MKYMKAKMMMPALILGLLLGTTLLMGCDAFGDDDGGRVHVRLVDAPLDSVAEARVTIQRVEILTASDNRIVLTDSSQTFDLLKLQDGVSALMADVEVPDGRYSQIRLIVGENSTLIMQDGSTVPLKVPSGTQTGIKLQLPEFEIDDEDDLVVITVDFDAEQSFVKAGQSGKFVFKPVVRAESIVINGQETNLDDSGDNTGSTDGTQG